MKFEVLLSETATKQLRRLENQDIARIKKGIVVLKEDPFRRRPKADIKKLKGFSNPSVYRLRIGDFRATYSVDAKMVRISDIFRRGKGYKWL